jgi:hypothetical protein
MGVCTYPGPWECTLVIPPVETDDMCLETIILASSIMVRKGFLGSTPEYPLEPQMCFLKSCALFDCFLCPGRFHRRKLTTGGSKYVPLIYLKWAGRNMQNTPLSRATTQTLSLTLAPSLVELHNH